MKELIQGVSYEYLGTLQTGEIRYTEMKEKVTAEYLMRSTRF